MARAFSTSPFLSSASGRLTVVLLMRSGAVSTGARRGQVRKHLAGQDCAHPRGVAEAALGFLPVNVNVVDVAAAAGGEERDHFRAFEVSQAAAQGRRHVGRDQGLADVVEMDRVIDVSGDGLVVGRLEEDDRHVGVDRARRLDDQRVSLSRVPADGAVFHVITAVEGDRGLAAPRDVRA